MFDPVLVLLPDCCGGCRFWRPADRSVALKAGCHVHGPTVMPFVGGDKSGFWPDTWATDWCGEHQARRPKLRYPPPAADWEPLTPTEQGLGLPALPATAPGFRRHWVNDLGDRVYQFLRAGWNIVPGAASWRRAGTRGGKAVFAVAMDAPEGTPLPEPER